MAGYIDVDVAIKVSRDLQKKKAETLAAIDMVRTDLRHAVKLGGCTPEQVAYVTDTYPNVKRTRKAK